MKLVIMRQKNTMKTYIIRIYRHSENDPGSVVGTVEKVGVNGKMTFSSRDELWEIMNAGTMKQQQRKRQNNDDDIIRLHTSNDSTNKKGENQ